MSAGHARAAQGPLKGAGVLVTRPAHQADAFCRMVEAAGGVALRFPVMEIRAPRDSERLDAVIDALDDFDIAIFISPNAVSMALNRIHARRHWPDHLRIGAVGRKSAQELARAGHAAHICPPRRFDSEALLAEAELQDVAGKRIVIFRGDGGRELLGDTLKERGAQVEYAEAYRRARPDADTGQLLHHWSRGELHLATSTSSEGLRNLFDMVGKLGRMWLRKTPLVVGSTRMVDTARELGFQGDPWVAEDPSDESMMDTVLQWAKAREQQHEQ
ncbi:uroporphyrinogen III synthase [Thioalkalivibrio denitrificans]|uniref:Uroporphyrinogen-III synthase n=1 Tax=Thioalkalivibrio denitrificans TaxID=108003 RepID=A0A1V3NJ16_9GAMM|nr:uroporphyrinogen-III synthase [Thioalkalivibrio denitrificans]OOG25050.1 uroporphyrinogen III synthase [Thioalkalivibrio denitrificans]